MPRNFLPRLAARPVGARQAIWTAVVLLGAFVPLAASGQCNQPPIAMNDSAESCGLPTLIDVLANDWAPEGDVLSVTLGSHDCSGAVTVSYDMLELVPDGNWTTSCTISYQAVDEWSAPDSAEVTVGAVICVQIFADGFESGDTLQWDVVEGGA